MIMTDQETDKKNALDEGLKNREFLALPETSSTLVSEGCGVWKMNLSFSEDLFQGANC